MNRSKLAWQDIQSSLAGAWDMVLGRTDGMRRMDFSADGFWNSFQAITVSLPAQIGIWAVQAMQVLPSDAAPGARLDLIGRFAVCDIVAWVLPIILLAFGLSRTSFRKATSPVVVSNNWLSALQSWMLLPIVLISFYVPGWSDALLFIIAVLSIVMTWRLNFIVFNRDIIATSLAVIIMIGLQLALYSVLPPLLDIPVATPSAG